MNYYPSSCGLLGVLRKNNSGKISGKYIADALNSIRYRGSDRGSGYAMFNLNGNNYYKMKIYYNGNESTLNEILKDKNVKIKRHYREISSVTPSYCYELELDNNDISDDLNALLWKGQLGRVYSSGTSLDIFKGVGYPDAIATQYNVYDMHADMWLAHTRQPTNSPGNLPYWSHPFSSFNIAIVHNGDISSFGANREYLSSKGIKSFVGTDSEVISYIFKELLKKYDLITAIKIMGDKIDDKYTKYINRGCALDGPYTLAIGYDDGKDLYLIGLTDNTKLRPSILGEDENNYYIASEEKEIRLINKDAKVWTMEPDSYFIASLKKGIIEYGRKGIRENALYYASKFDIDAEHIEYNKLDNEIMKLNKKNVTVNNVSGQRYVGIKFTDKNINLKMYGNMGNCLMNLNENNDTTVYGNVADDCCDSMSGGKVKIFGNAGDILGQALNNGRIYVNGDVGNRCGIQMRAYKENMPYIVINGKFDDYLGEYMSGGVIIALSNYGDCTGKYIGSGMIGGKIYIHGKIKSGKIGLQPNNVNSILKALLLESLISKSLFEKLNGRNFIDIVNELPEDAGKYVKKLYNRHEMPSYSYRKLKKDEYYNLLPVITDFDIEMKTSCMEKLDGEFTVIEPRN
jgi:glutamate synthase domain-containing protein 1/glutamate synthase domain-containing protein 3